ncbi:hypothetical protein WR25_22903 [Diploscapter pachys]|uniref:Uncharacterized protein n=1 Tax=Diploscapter pachys TaxID=2018661 RepID=A0A2A2KTL0_9BILA|nr:hypothetical protein WR25_22903 [Diploscapter pachys]
MPEILMYQILSRNLADSHHIKKKPSSQNQFSASVIEGVSKDQNFTSEGQMSGTRIFEREKNFARTTDGQIDLSTKTPEMGAVSNDRVVESLGTISNRQNSGMDQEMKSRLEEKVLPHLCRTHERADDSLVLAEQMPIDNDRRFVDLRQINRPSLTQQQMKIPNFDQAQKKTMTMMSQEEENLLRMSPASFALPLGEEEFEVLSPVSSSLQGGNRGHQIDENQSRILGPIQSITETELTRDGRMMKIIVREIEMTEVLNQKNHETGRMKQDIAKNSPNIPNKARGVMIEETIQEERKGPRNGRQSIDPTTMAHQTSGTWSITLPDHYPLPTVLIQKKNATNRHIERKTEKLRVEGGLISLQIKQSNKLGHCRDPAEGSHEHRQTDGDPYQQSPQVSRNSQENRGYEKEAQGHDVEASNEETSARAKSNESPSEPSYKASTTSTRRVIDAPDGEQRYSSYGMPTPRPLNPEPSRQGGRVVGVNMQMVAGVYPRRYQETDEKQDQYHKNYDRIGNNDAQRQKGFSKSMIYSPLSGPYPDMGERTTQAMPKEEDHQEMSYGPNNKEVPGNRKEPQSAHRDESDSETTEGDERRAESDPNGNAKLVQMNSKPKDSEEKSIIPESSTLFRTDYMRKPRNFTLQ